VSKWRSAGTVRVGELVIERRVGVKVSVGVNDGTKVCGRKRVGVIVSVGVWVGV